MVSEGEEVKASIGFHDLSKLEFPLRYDTVSSNASFSPLGFKEAVTIARDFERD